MPSTLKKPHILYDQLNTALNALEGEAPFHNWGYESKLEKQEQTSSLSAQERLVAELIGSVSLDHKRILDIKCGGGGALHSMTRSMQPLSVTGIDSHSTPIKNARKLLAEAGARFHLGDICQLPFSDKSHDVIFYLEAFGISPNMIELLQQVCRILDTNGLFLYGDIWPCDLIDPLKQTMEALGFACEELRNVSYEVCQARMNADLSFLEPLRQALEWEDDDFSTFEDLFALPGSSLWSCLERGSAAYLLTRWRRLDRSSSAGEPSVYSVLNERIQRIGELISRERLFLESRQEKLPFKSPTSHTDLNILAFPYAFAGASVYRTWSQHLPPQWNFCPVQLPARENRITDPPAASISEIIDEIFPHIAPHLDTPLVLLGWCLGGTIAFELCMRLQEQKLPLPKVLIVGMCASPEHKHPPTKAFFDPETGLQFQTLKGLLDSPSEVHSPPKILSDSEQGIKVEALQSILDPFLERPEMLDILKDCIKNDIYLATTYDRSEGKIQTPLVALAGYDDPVAPSHAVETWKNWGAHSFEFHRVSGTHFAPRDSSQEMALFIRRLIEKYLEQ